MRALSDAEFVNLECWLFAVYFGFAELFHLFRTLFLLLHCKIKKKSATLDRHRYSPYVISICMALFLNFSRFERLPLIPTIICISGWLFIPFCVILQEKLVSGKDWRKFLEDAMDRFFNFFVDARKLLIFMDQRLGKVIRGAFLICIMLAAIYTSFRASLPDTAFMVALFFLPFFYFGIQFAMHSCKMLIVFWLSHCLLFAIGVAATVHLPLGSTFHNAAAYTIFILLYTSLWLLTAGVADDDVAKMASNIINTGTTILVILINVLVGWGLNQLGKQAVYRSLLEQLQYYGNLILLPLIISGYLSALLKEMQIYWFKRHH